jgi:hypothetical protein
MTQPALSNMLSILLFAFLSLGFCSASASPPAPAWSPTWSAGFSIRAGPAGIFSGMIYYSWPNEGWSQTMVNSEDQHYTILNVGTNTWRVDQSNQSCCLCTSPWSCGHVTPPRPTWLQEGNTTEFLGTFNIDGRSCIGWAKTIAPIAKFGWWVTAEGGLPCQVSWLYNPASNLVLSNYSEDPKDIPPSVFQVPEYCPTTGDDPNCSISGF